uniref:Uncharacterized protein n=1 Tax=Anguilla anguilla TaxID=7936 RepID=A0A0E9VD99_ANGAN
MDSNGPRFLPFPSLQGPYRTLPSVTMTELRPSGHMFLPLLPKQPL